MIILKFMGGLGNQMFQYAVMRALQKFGKEVKVNLSFYEKSSAMSFVLEDAFKNIKKLEKDIKDSDSFENAFQSRKIGQRILEKVTVPSYHFYEKRSGLFDERVFSFDNGILEGYWQSEKYFEMIKPLLLEEFEFIIQDNGIESLENEMRGDVGATSIHVRGGDYIQFENRYGKICTQQYYLSAMKYLQQQNSDIKFYVFSDDIKWAKNTLGTSNIKYISSKEVCDVYYDWYDMYLMSICKNNIIANSSFSWWAAWLNKNSDKKIVAPRKWMNNCNTRDVWCENWIKL